MAEKIYIILLLNLVFYAKTITYKYSSDDIPVSQREHPKSKLKMRLQQLEGCIRTLPHQDHFLTMIVHALVCVFIYTGFGATNVSFLASLLFAFNPINNQGSVWISGRGYVLSALGITAAMTFPLIGPLLLVGATYSNAGFLAPLALGGSEHAWMLCFLPFIWWFHSKRFKKNVVAKIKMEMYTADKSISFRKLVIGLKTFTFYITHSLLPIKTTFYHSYMQSMAGSGRQKAETMKDRFFFIGIFVIAAILYRFIFCPWDMINFGLLWWCICIAPFCNMYRMQQEIGERYAYLPNVGLMIALANCIVYDPILAYGWVIMYATKMWFYMDCYMDDYYLVEYATLYSPDSWFAWHVRGMKRWDQKSYQEAVTLWTMAKLISPNEFKVLLNISTALKLNKMDAEAKEYFIMACQNVPEGQEEQCKKITDDWKKGQLSILL